MSGVVYKITCLENGKFYIGSTVSFRKRIAEHLRLLRRGVHHNVHMQHVYDKYGEDSLVTEVIEVVPVDGDLRVVEQSWINRYDFADLLNVSRYAVGSIYTDEAKKKIANSKIGSRNPMFGKSWTATKRQQMKDRMSGEGNHNYGKSIPNEVREKISAANKGRILSSETKAKMSLFHTGRPKPRSQVEASRIKKFKPVSQIDLATGEVVAVFGSILDAQSVLKISHVSSAAHGVYKSAGGYRWEFLDMGKPG